MYSPTKVGVMFARRWEMTKKISCILKKKKKKKSSMVKKLRLRNEINLNNKNMVRDTYDEPIYEGREHSQHRVGKSMNLPCSENRRKRVDEKWDNSRKKTFAYVLRCFVRVIYENRSNRMRRVRTSFGSRDKKIKTSWLVGILNKMKRIKSFLLIGETSFSEPIKGFSITPF